MTYNHKDRVFLLCRCLLGLWFVQLSFAEVQASPDCTGEALISESFDNGARWEFCWESRIRENLVLKDVYYTPPGGTSKRVLSSARLGQLHVAYDDSDVTYNDVTQYGLGGGYMVDLSAADCPLGTLLSVQGKAALCRWRSSGPDSYRMGNRAVQADSLTVFSVSQVGAYAYIITWIFYADGAIEPQIGASGALQRSSSVLQAPFGRVLEGDANTLWLSHTHNYYWRLDFDLGDSATDDVVTESKFVLNSEGQRLTMVERFVTEQARRINPDVAAAWHIWDGLDENAPEKAKVPGYLIEPVRFGHRLVREETEPYTEYDFFVTVANDCERFASQNARFNPDCANHVLQYANGESLVGQDLVVWNRVSFHHVPRNEDQRQMHTHWDGFSIEPVNVHSGTPGFASAPNQLPVIETLQNLRHNKGETVALHINASDQDGDLLRYNAAGLPPGIALHEDGQLNGAATASGTYGVTVSVSDDLASAETSFEWQIDKKRSKTGFGAFGLLSFCVALLLFARLTMIMRANEKS